MKKNLVTIFLSLSILFAFGGNYVHAAETDRFFTGQRSIENTGVYHFGARFYSPTLGIFIQPDRIEGINRYSYVRNNPVSLNDPTGNCPICIAGLLAWMSTMPMGSAPAASPQAETMIQEHWPPQSRELNMAFFRLINPLANVSVALNESATGVSLASGRSLSGFEQGLNVADIGIGAFQTADTLLGTANSIKQTRNVGRLKGAVGITGKQLLRAQSQSEAQNILSQAMPELGFKSRRSWELFKEQREAYFSTDNFEIVLPRNDNFLDKIVSVVNENPTRATIHEGIHALQKENLHPAFENPSWINRFNRENMAFASVNNRTSITRQLGQAMPSIELTDNLVVHESSFFVTAGMIKPYAHLYNFHSRIESINRDYNPQ